MAADDLPITERDRQLVEIAFGLSGQWIMPDQLDDYHLTPRELTAVLALTRALVEMERKHKAVAMRAERRARQLLRSYLTPAQRDQLRAGKAFLCHGSDGGVYRLSPRWHSAERVERHGRRWFARASYCLHDYADGPGERRLPPADVTLSQLLLLSADEPAFLALANARDRTDALWNRDYLRVLREARRERLAAGNAPF